MDHDFKRDYCLELQQFWASGPEKEARFIFSYSIITREYPHRNSLRYFASSREKSIRHCHAGISLPLQQNFRFVIQNVFFRGGNEIFFAG
jgi:hypothetical protein